MADLANDLEQIPVRRHGNAIIAGLGAALLDVSCDQRSWKGQDLGLCT
jgi:hypothetical protein